jgi:HK97 gp10 family phage protein
MAEVEGLKELSNRLAELGATLGGKALRQAAMLATTPAMKEIKAAAPVGKRAHKTHKGRLVAPGFTKRSIKRKSRLRKGRAVVSIGVLSEAFYGVHFVDQGTEKMDAQPWFKNVFIRNRQAMENALVIQLKAKIHKIAAKRS